MPFYLTMKASFRVARIVMHDISMKLVFAGWDVCTIISPFELLANGLFGIVVVLRFNDAYYIVNNV